LKIQKIISGGQTGADRAAFDFALKNGIEIGGFVPKNRLAEDGEIPEIYPNLQETSTENYAERTELNVKNSDATLIFSHDKLIGGSLLTKQFAELYEKPFFHIDFWVADFDYSVEKTRDWLESIDCKNLNIAGSRASQDSEIYPKIKEFLKLLFD
jgi:hypothetical protein